MKLSRRKGILVVDDDAEMREMLKESILNHFSEDINLLTIVEAPEGFTALKKINLQKFDLVITDLNMPRLDGKKLLEALKEMPQNQRPVNILVISGLLDPEKNTTAGNVTFMAKPWDETPFRDYLDLTLSDQVKPPEAKKNGSTTNDGPSQSGEVVIFITSFLTGTMEVMETFCKIKAENENKFIKKEGEASGDYSIIYFIDGEIIQSSIALSFEQNCFLGIASKLLGKKVESIDRESQNLSETITKHIIEFSQKAMQGYDNKLKVSDPIIIGGNKHVIKHLIQGSCLSFKIKTEFGYLYLEVVVQKKQK